MLSYSTYNLYTNVGLKNRNEVHWHVRQKKKKAYKKTCGWKSNCIKSLRNIINLIIKINEPNLPAKNQNSLMLKFSLELTFAMLFSWMQVTHDQSLGAN